MKKTAKILSMMMTAMMAFSMFSALGSTVMADEKVTTINGVHFPDKVLREYVLKNIDTNKNKVLERSEVNKVTSLSIKNNNFKNTNGLRYFDKLTDLTIISDNVSTFFIPETLKKLCVGGKKIDSAVDIHRFKDLESLTIVGCPELQGADFSDNLKLKSVAVRNCPKFRYITFNNKPNGITSLEFSNTDIRSMENRTNSTLRTLDLSLFPELESLDLSGSKQIEGVIVDKCTKLKSLNLSGTNIKSLDVSKCKNVAQLDLRGSSLTKLDVTNLANIKWLLNNGSRTCDLDKSFVSVTGKIGKTAARFDYNCWKLTIINGKTTIKPYKKGYIEPNKTQYAFVERMYTTCMKRASDPEGKEFWAEELATHRITGEYVGAFFFLSDEMVGLKLSDKEFVTRLYKTFMDREPEKGGFDFWCQYLKDGRSRSDVVYGFTRSEEFVNKCKKADIIPY